MTNSIPNTKGTGGTSGIGPLSGSGSVSAFSSLNSINNSMTGVSGSINMQNAAILDWMKKIDERLYILEPKKELLEKYEALQQAYHHYKLLEALLIDGK